MPSYQSAFQLNKVIQAHLLSIRRQAARCPNPFLDRLKQGQRDGDVPKAAPIVTLPEFRDL